MKISDFKNDIFISYAHIDNTTLSEEQEGWITFLHKALEFRVSQLFGGKPRIWRDPKLRGNDFFDDEIIQQFDSVAFFIAVLSPRYLKSKWCVREMQAFSQSAEKTGGIRIQNKARIFKVVKTPVPLESHPAEIQSLLGYDFFKRDPNTGEPYEFDKIQNPDSEKDFWKRLNDLAYDISQFLQLLETGITDTKAPEPETGKKYVYLADTSFDLKEQHAQIQRELKAQQWNVLPDQQLPLTAPEYKKQVATLLEKCQLAIHLIGENRGIVPDGSRESVTEIQNHLAASQSQSTALQRIIWLPPHLESTNPEHARFLRTLRTDKTAIEGADLLERPFEDLLIEIKNKLNPPKKEKKPETPSSPKTVLQVYLICDKRDLPAIQEIDDALYDQGFDVVTPVFEGDVKQVREDHEETLRTCDAVIIYYGAANELWLRAKLRELNKIFGQGRTNEYLAKFIYVGGPETDEKQRYRTRDAQLIKHYDPFKPDVLAPFLEEIGRRKEAKAHE